MKSLKTFVFTIASIVISTQLKAQAPEIAWDNTIGGNEYDYLQSVRQTTDGGYILGGYTRSGISGDKTEASLGENDYWVVKLSFSGDIEWQNTIGGSGFDELQSVQQTTDGGFILGGYSNSPVSEDKSEGDPLSSVDYWVVKIDASGDIEWDNTIGGNSNDWLYSVQQTTDGGFILGGYSTSPVSGDKSEGSLFGSVDYWVVKIDASGGIEWQNTIRGNSDDLLYSIQQTYDGGYILGGYSNSGIFGDKTEVSLGENDYWVVKLDDDGVIEWQNTIGGSSDDLLYSIQQSSDGGYILGGYSESGISGDKNETNIGGSDYWVVKLDTSGNIEWQNTIGGNSWDILNSVQQTEDGGYILGGYSHSGVSGDKTEASMGSDIWSVKLNSTGNIESQNTIGGSTFDFLFSSHQTADGGYILGGSSKSNISGDKTEANLGDYDYWVVKLNPDCTAINYYADADDDGYGNILNDSLSCNIPVGYVAEGTDCNDANNLINPSATEICNTLDDNCDGNTDEGLTFTTYYLDADADGFGNTTDSIYSCSEFAGYVANNFDCNDADNLINSTTLEICNAVDDNCDGNEDEGLTFITYFFDADLDGFGNTTDSIYSCSEIAGYVANNLDCNDANNLINPAATEICNAIDDNCDGNTDEGLTFNTYYLDADADGFGDVLVSTSTCDGPPASYVEDSSDCNDANNSINIGTKEICNAIDDNCDGNTDEGFTFTTYYFDADADEFGDALISTTTCDGSPTGYINDSTDCDDTNPNIYPGATEILNGIDDNCNQVIDEGLVNINSIENNFFINIYPNPANNKITIAFNEQINTEAQITITDITGKLISSFQLQPLEQQLEIDISSYAASLYFVKLQYDGITELQKFIKE
ncbi:MAG: T9SS type A sorting domain-containing protein [Fimbriimonadaceae bacterium]|nr:T9SS type A sorting domain-containing protein [Chitinophagales bacterium]